jgi:hypothetical protein
MSHEFMEQKRSQARGPNRTPEGKIGALVATFERCALFRRAERENFKFDWLLANAGPDDVAASANA